MQIEIDSTPPGKHTNKEQEEVGGYNTPQKISRDYDTPERKPRVKDSSEYYSTPLRKENPESKRRKEHTHESSGPKISAFVLNRLEEDYEFLRRLGSGNFSNVGLYESRLTKEKFAIKMGRANMMSVNYVQALGTLSIFGYKSKNIVRYYHSWVEEGVLYLVMEYCERSLNDHYVAYREAGKIVPEDELKKILKQGLKGLLCLHAHEMVHLDIKPYNILFQGSTLKISDLGLCRSRRIRRDSDLEEGDARYLAREVLNYHEGIDLTKADIFSLGMTLYEGLTLEVLPNNGPQWRSFRDNGLQLQPKMELQEYSNSLLRLVESMTSPDWRQRPTAQYLLVCEYLRETHHRPKYNLLSRSSARSNRLKYSSL